MNGLTITELAKELGITYQGALKKVRTNQEQLKEYLLVDNKGNIRGIEREGLEAIRNLPHRISYVSKQAQEQDKLNALKESEINSLNEIIKTKEQFINELLKDKEEQKAKIVSLESELEAYRNGGFLTRLLGYKKK